MENDIIVKRNRDNKKKHSPKKSKQKTSHTSSSHQNSADDASAQTNLSSNTVVTSIFARESKRATFLRSHMSTDSHRKFPPGAPVGHISRQLNADTGMNVNIDYNTTSQLFAMTTDTSKLLSFNSKKKPLTKSGTLPPIERSREQEEANWDQRMYPSCELFENMTPRKGGFYPDNVQSKRKEVRRKPVVNKGFSIRFNVQESVDKGRDNTTGNVASTSSEFKKVEEEEASYDKLVKQLSKKGASLSLNDLSQIAKMSNPHDYVNLFFRYLHILILGFDQKRPASRRDTVNGTGGEPDARQTLLKECSPLLLYLQHVSKVIVQ